MRRRSPASDDHLDESTKTLAELDALRSLVVGGSTRCARLLLEHGVRPEATAFQKWLTNFFMNVNARFDPEITEFLELCQEFQLTTPIQNNQCFVRSFVSRILQETSEQKRLQQYFKLLNNFNVVPSAYHHEIFAVCLELFFKTPNSVTRFLLLPEVTEILRKASTRLLEGLGNRLPTARLAGNEVRKTHILALLTLSQELSNIADNDREVFRQTVFIKTVTHYPKLLESFCSAAREVVCLPVKRLIDCQLETLKPQHRDRFLELHNSGKVRFEKWTDDEAAHVLWKCCQNARIQIKNAKLPENAVFDQFTSLRFLTFDVMKRLPSLPRLSKHQEQLLDSLDKVKKHLPDVYEFYSTLFKIQKSLDDTVSLSYTDVVDFKNATALRKGHRI